MSKKMFATRYVVCPCRIFTDYLMLVFVPVYNIKVTYSRMKDLLFFSYVYFTFFLRVNRNCTEGS